MEVEENNNQIIFSADQNPPLRIQNSFKDYFIGNLKEIPGFFKEYKIPHEEANIKRYLNENMQNKNLLELLPINIINPENFIEQYANYINLIHKKPNKISHFTNFEQNEIQLLYLLNHINLAKEKIDKYLNLENKDFYTNNHLIKINNIIKNNPKLIGYIYILKWLQKIITLSYEEYNEDESIYNIINNRKPISGEKDDPIKLEEKCLSNNNEEYNNLMKQFIYCLFKGNIYESQIMCERRQIEEFGNIFSGGCPLFDKIISNENDYNNFDKDLISPSMYNKDYKDFIDLIEEGNIINENENDNKNIFGNSLYILWFKVMYENADCTKDNTILNYLFRLISGNYKNYELNNNNIYEYLYINILNLLHSKIFYELTQNPKEKMVQYHYIESDTFKEISQVFKNDGRDIYIIINSIIQNNNYNLLLKRYPFLLLELSFIKLFFLEVDIKENIINNNNENNSELYKKYFDGLAAITNKMKKGNDSLNMDYNDYNDIINNEREFNYSNLSNRKIQTSEFYDMINICLYRAFFSSLTTFYSINKDFIDLMVNNDNENNLGEIAEQIFDNFDEIYCNYIKHIIKLNNDNVDFDLIIYITTYMFNIKNIIFILTEISHYIYNNEKYQEFIYYLKKFYENIIYDGENLSIYITKIITNNSNLLKIGENKKKFNCIDDALNNYIELKMENNFIEELTDNDKYKINQILCLFEQTENNKLNQDTSYSYLLKLFIKFLINYKYKEAYELNYQLKDYIYDKDAPTDELILAKIPELEILINKINSMTDPEEIQFYTILSSRYLFIIILNCFYFYANKIIIPYYRIKNNNNKSKNKNQINNDKEELSKNINEFIKNKIFNLNKLIKIIIGNEILFNYSMNYYGEETKNEFQKLLGDWAFQGIKWICDIFYMGIIDKNEYDSLNTILDETIYNKDMMNKYFLMNGFNNNDAYNVDDIIIKREKKLFDIMDNEQKQKVIECLYKMAKINRPYLNEIFDDELAKNLNEDKKQVIQELDFDFDE